MLVQAGWHVAPADVPDRLQAARQSGAVLVTTAWQGLSGLVAVQWGAVLHAPRPLARLTAIVVDEEERRHGIGRLLLKAASQAARTAGCDEMEAQPAGEPASAFLQANGFSAVRSVAIRSLRRHAA